MSHANLGDKLQMLVEGMQQLLRLHFLSCRGEAPDIKEENGSAVRAAFQQVDGGHVVHQQIEHFIRHSSASVSMSKTKSQLVLSLLLLVGAISLKETNFVRISRAS